MAKNYIRIVAVFLIFTTGIQFSAYCQLFFNEDMVNVKGQIIDEMTKEPVSYVQILNLRVRGGTMSDAKGSFSIQADPLDTLTFKSLNYKDKRVPVKDIFNTENGVAKIELSPVKIMLGQVEISSNAPKVNMNGIPVGKSVDVPVELRSDYFASKPKTLAVLSKPLSFISYYTSKDEKEKRATLSAIHSERDWKILSLVYNKDVIQKVSGFKGDALEDFMLFCNAFNALPINATSYDVEKRIRELMIEYFEKKTKEKTPVTRKPS
jgi:hypothetical protein